MPDSPCWPEETSRCLHGEKRALWQQGSPTAPPGPPLPQRIRLGARAGSRWLAGADPVVGIGQRRHPPSACRSARAGAPGSTERAVAVKTQLPDQLLQASFQDKDCKVMLWVLPTSLYVQDIPEHGTLGEILEIFTDGRVAYGSWYKHVWGWWERKQKKQLLSLFCDNMKKMREILWFLGKEVVQGMVVRILHHRSFGHMRKNPAANYEAMCTALMDHSLSPFLWKGGNWKNHFTVAQHYWEQQ
uniref:Sulfotransferase n=1 Tax=Melopsittacus undulatus TaxID=13146 RepID=A0A8C6IR41_MELUD